MNILLNEPTGWRGAALDKTVVSHCGGNLELAPAPGAVRPLVDAAGAFGGLTLPIGVAVDREGRIYVLDAATETVKVFDPCQQAFTTLPCVGGPGSEPRRLKDARAIAVSRRDDLYIADAGNGRVQVFALKGLVLRDIWDLGAISRSGVTTWRPVDLAIDRNGFVYVADYDNGMIHVFDRRGCWKRVLTNLVKPVHIALDREGRVYVVEEGKASVKVLNADGTPAGEVKLRDEVDCRFVPLAIAVDGDGNLHISDTLYREVAIVCRAAGGTFVRQGFYSGPAVDLTFDNAGTAIVVDPSKKQVATVPAAALFMTSGTFYSEGLDSRLYQCVWHRVAISAAIPQGCQVSVDTLTAESDKSTAEILTLPEDRWAKGQIDSQTGDGEWDCLVQSPPGRFLWLRLTLQGEAVTTPSIHRIRVHYPRQSSLQYLPAVFSEDRTSQAFLDQFLSIFDKFWGGFSHQLDGMARYFDPAATPAPDFLAWLASWLGLTLDRHWTVDKRRRLLEQAHRLYALRGTPEGLRLHLRLYTGAEPTILEHFKLRRWLFTGSARLNSQSALWGSEIINRLQLDEHAKVGESQIIDNNDPLHDPFWANAHRFSVFVPVKGGGTDTERQTIARIVEMAKPAHTQGDAYVLNPRFRIGIQSYIGVDAVIGRYPEGIFEGKGKLGYDTVLSAGAEACPPAMRIGETSRIGSGTRMN